MKDEIGIQRGRFTSENIPSGSPSSPYLTHTCVMERWEQNRANIKNKSNHYDYKKH